MEILNRTIAGSFTAMMLMPALAGGQVPGVAVLQNAFTSRGMAVAANFGSGGGQSYYGAAAAWGLNDRFLISGAAGALRSREATRGAYGGRLTAGVWSSRGGALGAAAFAGIGGAARTRSGSVVTNPAIATIPAGISIGYRRGMGARGSLSGYISPFYRWNRIDSGTVVSTGAMRVSAGIDVGFSSSFGASLGGEFGSGRQGGGGGSVLGAAITYVPGRR